MTNTINYRTIAGPDCVILAEKASVAADIAAVIGAKSSSRGHIICKDGTNIIHAQGHLVEIASPEEHNPDWGGRWSWGQLPMIPETWKYNQVEKTKSLYKTIMPFIKAAKHLIIATDAGREGELIARELMVMAKYKGKYYRYWTSSGLATDIKEALDKLLPGQVKDPLYEAALARSHLDNVYGFTGSRSATLAANVFRETFPMGRVQTAVLGLVVDRTNANRAFSSSFYYELFANVKTSGGHTLKLKHEPKTKEKCTDEKVIQALKNAILANPGGLTGKLNQVVTPTTKGAPLAFSIGTLQTTCNKILGLTAKKTLEVAQELYEGKFMTYPRTDSQHLGTAQIAKMEETLDAIAKVLPEEVAELRKMGILYRPSTFDDTKLGDHPGIVPTVKPGHTLSGVNLQVYRLICAQTLMLLAPDYLYDSVKVSMSAGGETFSTTGKRDKQAGWTKFRGIR